MLVSKNHLGDDGFGSMGFRVVHELSGDQIDDLIELYKFTYWAAHRTRADVERMLANTDLVFGVVDDASGRLCGFARALSDKVFRAVVFDVVVHPEYQGHGLGRMVMEAITSHPMLKDIEQIVLYCKPDVVELYRKWGFTEDLDDMGLMIRKGPLLGP